MEKQQISISISEITSPTSEEYKDHTEVNAAPNVITASKTENIERSILMHERRKSFSYTINWPEPSTLLAFIVAKRHYPHAISCANGIIEYSLSFCS